MNMTSETPFEQEKLARIWSERRKRHVSVRIEFSIGSQRAAPFCAGAMDEAPECKIYQLKGVEELE
ncbi:MAG: hypothetical protein JJE04_01860 [Acidobacteriia bacterium]|nr:hypothetical protein [Terriglobia bacterium]